MNFSRDDKAHPVTWDAVTICVLRILGRVVFLGWGEFKIASIEKGISLLDALE